MNTTTCTTTFGTTSIRASYSGPQQGSVQITMDLEGAANLSSLLMEAEESLRSFASKQDAIHAHLAQLIRFADSFDKALWDAQETARERFYDQD